MPTPETLVQVAREFAVERDMAERCAPYAPYAYTPDCSDWPALHIDDVSGIPFLQEIAGVELYQLRARVRAGQGDLFAATCPELLDYEDYNRRLGLGSTEFIYAPPVGAPIEIAAALGQGQAFEQLCRAARARGRLLIHPYMGIEAVWSLAARVADKAGVPVRVLAPPPPVTWFANDKSEVTAVVEALLGTELVCETRRGRSAEALSQHLLTLAGRHESVALKMTRCASAMGNRVFSATEALALSDGERVAEVARFLKEKEWRVGDDVLVCSWEDNTDSPSSQCWIPPAGAGDVRIDGLYEQLLKGPERMFLGSLPSRLDADIETRMATASRAVATVYQALGYVGRCSFDFITPGDALRFVECNGRWGGTSTPMHLLDRLFPAGRPAYRARDFVVTDLLGCDFAELERRVGDALYDPATGQGRFVLYNVGPLTDYGKFDVIAMGPDPDAAERALEHELPALISG
jgi:hypothetical protein